MRRLLKLVGELEGDKQGCVETRGDPAEGELEGSADGMDEGEPKVGGALRKLVGWLEGSEEGCVETRDDTADGELEESRQMAQTSDLK